MDWALLIILLLVIGIGIGVVTRSFWNGVTGMILCSIGYFFYQGFSNHHKSLKEPPEGNTPAPLVQSQKVSGVGSKASAEKSSPSTSGLYIPGTILVSMRPVKAFKPENPAEVIGEFKSQTPLVIGKNHPSGRMEVLLIQPDGKSLNALCDPAELRSNNSIVPGKILVCKKAVKAYNPADETQVLGEFKKDTSLLVGMPASSGKASVTMSQPDGKKVSAVCNPLDFFNFEPQIEGWTTDFEAAKRAASSSGKVVLMDFTGSDWCHWCMKLDSEVFSKPEFLDYARENLVLVKLDFPEKTSLPFTLKEQNQRLAQTYGVKGFPTVVLCNDSGTPVGIMGYMEGGPSAFIQKLKQITRR